MQTMSMKKLNGYTRVECEVKNKCEQCESWLKYCSNRRISGQSVVINVTYPKVLTLSSC